MRLRPPRRWDRMRMRTISVFSVQPSIGALSHAAFPLALVAQLAYNVPASALIPTSSSSSLAGCSQRGKEGGQALLPPRFASAKRARDGSI
jgi:hypothetical protein